MLILIKQKPEKYELAITMKSIVFTEELLKLPKEYRPISSTAQGCYVNRKYLSESLNPRAHTTFQSVLHVILFT